MTLAVAVVRATSDEFAMVAQLMQLYLHDFSEFAPLGSPHGEIGRDGRFIFPNLASYWTQPRREVLLVRVAGRLAGFILINDWSASGQHVEFAIAEFFIARKYRRNGFGTEAARQAIQGRSGAWEIAVAAYNVPALAFWKKALPEIHGGRIDIIHSKGSRWEGPIYRLQSGDR